MKSTVLLICLEVAIGLRATAQSKSDEQGQDTTPSKPARSSTTTAWTKSEGQRPGDERADNDLSLKLVWCPKGSFTMGSPKSEEERDTDEDQVNVTLTKGFWLGKYEVTQKKYKRMMGKNPSWFSAQGDGKQKVAGQDTRQFPVEQVSWDEAFDFCRKLTDQERQAGRLPAGWEYTLPTEAQWEYAYRAETTTVFSFGNQLNGREANCNGNSPYGTTTKGPYLERTTTVGSYNENKWGLCDMHGNVWEWCRDWYADKLPGGTDPEVTSKGSFRVRRGGGWGLSAAYCRSANRSGNMPSIRHDYLGFRVALSPSSR